MSAWQTQWEAEAVDLGILDRIEFWGDKVATSRSPKQFEFARVRYNALVDSLRGSV